tara:strand:- start:778 stop:1464 length:687 start_codon:yes stop_codon:yes gene_type:complete
VLENNKFILILGSKPNSIIPKVDYSHIYAANGASALARSIIEANSKVYFTSVVGGREFLKNSKVQFRVINSKPDRLISRVTNIDTQQFNFSKEMEYKFFNNLQQLNFQSNFFKFGIIDVIFKELNYEIKFINKLKHFIKIIKSGYITGISTGFFAFLHAIYENPGKKIIISGIGMSAGGHFYKKETDEYTNRSYVDRKLILNLKEKFRDNVYTTDENLANIGKFKLWK